MVPKHNDDPYNDDDEEEQVELRTPAVAVAVSSAAYKFPLKLTSSLTGSCGFALSLSHCLHQQEGSVLVGFTADNRSCFIPHSKTEDLLAFEVFGCGKFAQTCG